MDEVYGGQDDDGMKKERERKKKSVVRKCEAKSSKVTNFECSVGFIHKVFVDSGHASRKIQTEQVCLSLIS